ncbi:MAG: class II fructose-bisphosphate aldolase [Bacilli bacterium]
MALVSVKQLVDQAYLDQRAVAAFNVSSIEVIKGVIKASETLNQPIIIQIAQGRLKHFPLSYIGPMMVEAAKQAQVDIAVSFDHGFDLELIKEALRYGFSGIMYDGSSLSIEENIKHAKSIKTILKDYEASLECEVGSIGGSEGMGEHQSMIASYSDVKQMIEANVCDLLAIAIGNAHGHYQGVPQLDIAFLKKVHHTFDLPLVLHGGTGLSNQDFKECIRNGVSKINIATALFDGILEEIRNLKPKDSYFDLSNRMVETTCKMAMYYITLFNLKEE